MNTRILITGGLGYLGGRMASLLAREAGYSVRLGSRELQTAPPWLPEAEMVKVDLNEPASLLLALKNIHTVIHLAAMNANECSADPCKALWVNGLGTMKLLQAAMDAGVQRFIYFSTAHVYGKHFSGHITEKTCTTSIHPYASSHLAGENVVRYAQETGKLEGIVIRLSNAYGSPMHKGVNCWMLLVNDLCRQAVTTKKMVLNSSGLQRRDFIPIAELGNAVMHLLKVPKKDLDSGLFNVGGEWSPTVLEMALLIQKRCETVLGFCPTLTRVEPKKEESMPPLNYCLDALNGTGFQLGHDRTSEIDELLKFCSVAFL